MNEMIQSVMADVVKWRRELHQIPEIGVDLPQTSDYVCKKLDEMGVSYKKGVGLEHAIVATMEGTKQGEGKTLALRADMDALPIAEESGLPFASKNGNMHACGHDGHTAILLGAIKVLSQMKNQFSGKLVFLFQPGEEISAGAEPMIQAGCLDGVDGIVGIHVGDISSDCEPGKAYFKLGPMMACLDKWHMTISGKGSHGAYPHNSFDPVVMQAHIITAVQEIISRELNPVDPGVVTVGIVQGGTAYNIIPGSVYLEGTARAVNKTTREFISKRIGEIAESVAKTFRGSVDFTYIYGAPPVVNDDAFTLNIMESSKKVLGEENVKFIYNPVMGGEDYAYYLEKVPGTFIFLSNPLKIDGFNYPHHNSKFALDEQYFERGVAIFVQSAMDFLK
ncbi:MAG: amidohydrolase [Acidaminobacter sp.]|uniref:M20 metallopeptidase family protein n=1 Tax=Acidaminobacter sp. TaxID=1872102 RepID=UPI001381E831|nr:M20 family metallopeptidase [Acidaminobacter sp.]MZQ99565.1 amidohydrolase [Acidaminobacter sp.]